MCASLDHWWPMICIRVYAFFWPHNSWYHSTTSYILYQFTVTPKSDYIETAESERLLQNLQNLFIKMWIWGPMYLVLKIETLFKYLLQHMKKDQNEKRRSKIAWYWSFKQRRLIMFFSANGAQFDSALSRIALSHWHCRILHTHFVCYKEILTGSSCDTVTRM